MTGSSPGCTATRPVRRRSATCSPGSCGRSAPATAALPSSRRSAAEVGPGSSGLVALDWFNGNRTILADADLTGSILGLTLQTTPAEIYRALLESIAFGNRRIMDNFTEHGLGLDRIVACGGIAERSPLLMQIIADVSGREVDVPDCREVPARGAALFGAVAAGAFAEIGAAVQRTRPATARTFTPDPAAAAVYDRVYRDLRRAARPARSRAVGAAARAQAHPRRKEGVVTDRPQIGLLGIMQELYDDMVPGITDRQSAYAAEVAAALAGVADVTFLRPARNREDIESITRELVARGVDGIAIVMLTYGPAMRTVRALEDARVPLLLANIQPQRSITADWTMDDLTYNQGIHGAQDQANALVRSGAAVLGADRRLALGRVRHRLRRLGAGRAGGDGAAQHEGRAARLPDERDGRHPARSQRAPAAARRDGRRGGPRRAGDADRRGVGRRDRRAARGRPRALRRGSRPAAASATPTRRGWSSRSAVCCRRAATPASRSTSTRSAATGASASCRCSPRRT